MVKFFIDSEDGKPLVKAPQRTTSTADKKGDAGFDFFVPHLTEKFVKDFIAKNQNNVAKGNVLITGEGITVEPGYDVIIPSYVHSLLPYNVELEGNEKSGVSTKKHLQVGAKIVDPSYTGVIHIHLQNIGMEPQDIDFGEKIAQFVPKYFDAEQHEVVTTGTLEDFYSGMNTDRGAGWAGSTGTK